MPNESDKPKEWKEKALAIAKEAEKNSPTTIHPRCPVWVIAPLDSYTSGVHPRYSKYYERKVKVHMSDKLQVRIWEGIRIWYGEVLEMDAWESDPTTGMPKYNKVYETEADTYGRVMINVALSMIRNTTEEGSNGL